MARKHGLNAKNEAEQLRVELAEQQAHDLMSSLIKVCFPSAGLSFDTLKEAHLKVLPPLLELFSKFLGSRKFIAGDYVTYADFPLYNILDFHQLFTNESALDEFGNLRDYLKRVEQLPRLCDYLNSPAYVRVNALSGRMQLSEWKV